MRFRGRKHPSGIRYSRPMRILALLLEHGPMTCAELCERGHFIKTGLDEPLRRLRGGRLIPLAPVRIADWRLVGNTYAPVYGIGTAKDAVRKPMTNTEHTNRYRRKYRAVLALKKRVKRGEQIDLFGGMKP